MLLKRIFLLLTLFAFNKKTIAQVPEDYSANWKKVESFEKKGLTSSALKEVVEIFNAAVTTGNESQQIKSAMYQVKYRNMIEENNAERNFLYIDTLIQKTKAPAKNILQSMQAELVWNYKRRNRYRFYNRTAIIEEKSNDISTWSLEKLNNTIVDLYKKSLVNDHLLKNTLLNEWDAILQKGTNTRNLRPTLYDFLAHRALRFFMNTENDVTKPSYKFILNDESAFAPAKTFINANISTKDSSSLYYNAILLLQDILEFHIADKDPDALLDADLMRLAFVYRYGVFTNKDELYENTLKQIESDYSTNPWAAQAMFLRAGIYYAKGATYDPFTKKDVQFDTKTAKELCEEAIDKFPGSTGAINCSNLLSTIKTKSIKIQTEKVNIPGQPFKSLIQYKNINTVYLRIIRTSREEIKRIAKEEYNKMWQQVSNLTAIKSWSVTLPDQQDYQQHSTEIKTGALTPGIYILLASANPDFNINKNLLAWQTTFVSNISYINNNKSDVYVLNRDNGQPLANAELQLWRQQYNYTTNNYEEVKDAKYVSDKNGYIKLKKSKNNNYNIFFQLKYDTDELFTDDSYYNYDYNDNEKPEPTRTFLFTDRSIYRSGQTVFFKGIVITSNKSKKNSIVPNKKSIIILADNNDQKVGRLNMTSNEYGSFSGSFKLPENLLNGEFSISDSTNGSVLNISVEEYKRPKFSVEIKKPIGTYRVNDSITVTGNAKAYAGNNIDGAKVSYRVVRKTQFPPWYRYFGFSKSWLPVQNKEQEITNGETVTDSQGQFTITFKAIPDETVNKKSQPVFYYEISTDITDLNGETRSGNTSVAVAYQALKLDIVAENSMHIDSLKNIKINSVNTNELFEKAGVRLIIQQLQSPNRIYRERYWQMPDQFTMTKDEFSNNFPFDAYADEDQVNKWPIGDIALDIADSTVENGAFHIPTLIKAGWYKLTATTVDKYGEEVVAEKFIEITENDLQANEEPVIIKSKKKLVEPGEKINYPIATGFDKIWLIQTTTRINKLTTNTYQTITNNKPYTNEIAITEEDRGGLNINYAFVKHNRMYNGNLPIAIPWDNKNLKISYETFRDKILPGSKEKWKIKISGNKSEKVAAEALIGMYDASLDQYKPQQWESFKSIWPLLNDNISWNSSTFMLVNSTPRDTYKREYISVPSKFYDRFITGGWDDQDYDGGRDYAVAYSWSGSDNYLNGAAAGVTVTTQGNSRVFKDKKSVEIKQVQFTPPKVAKDEEATSDERIEEIRFDGNAPFGSDNKNVQVRKNFNETSFFFPALNTDANGNIEFSFTMPEALTSWKMMTLAHTKDLASAYSEKKVITQKPLMAQPNAPRFLREGDRIEFSTKIVNLADSEITGTAQLELFDVGNNKPIDGWFKNMLPLQYFTVAPGKSTVIQFPLDIPISFNSAISYRIKAISKDGSFSDGEEAALPVLINRTLVTESMPLNMRNETTKNFKFDKLLNSNSSGSLTNHALTIEYTSNPAWYAVQALPYLMEYPYECAEQSFNRYYANTLASYVSNTVPKIKSIFEKWKTTDSTALISNLQKNEDLKSALLQETPWVLSAQNESQQKKNIAILFDMIRLAKEKENTLHKLIELQTSNGGFSWFKGGPDDRYITQYIITGIGHLRKLNAISNDDYNKLKPVVDKALSYLDARLKQDYDNLKKHSANLKENHLSYIAIQYLYMRSFFEENRINNNIQPAYKYYRSQSQQYWLSNSKYMQAMIALSLYRTGDEKTAKAIISSLKENAIHKEEMGMYWKELNTGGYYWYQSPIESQSIIIEAFSDIDKNNSTVDDLKTWLLKQKQTQNWKTTKATAEACYALLLNGNKWLSEEKEVVINLGNLVVKSSDEKNEAGTGYFKKTITGDKVQQGMGNITVSVNNVSNQPVSKSASWGAVYWQYFEDLDKITVAETPLKLVKKLFIEKNSDRGPVLEPLNDGDELHIGDKVKVRIELRSDRDMEYIHMKDMRAACMEPVNVLSQYKWQGGLGYYESTKDASTNFFFSWLPKGTYVFEYPMFVTHSGNFSNGITTIQCMYAPEFTSHSEGIRVNVADK